MNNLSSLSSGDTSKRVVFDLSSGTYVLDDARYFTDAEFIRDGNDLVLELPDGVRAVLQDYFASATPAMIEGFFGGSTLQLTPYLVKVFLRDAGQMVAQATAVRNDVVVGEVTALKGEVFVVLADGTQEALSAGDAIFANDVIETGDGSAIKLTMLDQTLFSLGANSRFSVNEFSYDPTTQEGESLFSVLKGNFLFVSGEMLGGDDANFRVNTPLAVVESRSAIFSGRIFGDEDAGDFRFTLLDGTIDVALIRGSLYTLDENFEFIVSFDGSSANVSKSDLTSIVTLQQDVFATLTPDALNRIEASLGEDSGENVGNSIKEVIELLDDVDSGVASGEGENAGSDVNGEGGAGGADGEVDANDEGAASGEGENAGSDANGNGGIDDGTDFDDGSGNNSGSDDDKDKAGLAAPTIVNFDATALNNIQAAYIVTFSEAVNFGVEDLNVPNGTVGDFEQSSTNPLQYSFSVTADDNFEGQMFVSVDDGVTSLAGNRIAGNLSANNVVVLDRASPTAMITPDLSVVNSSTDAITYTVAFSEEIFGFTTDNIEVMSGSQALTPIDLQLVEGSDRVYSFTVDVPPDSTETITARVFGAIEDAVGNTMAAVFEAPDIPVDREVPRVVSFGLIDPNVEVTAADREVEYRVEFSEAVSGLDVSAIGVENGLVVANSLTPSSDGVSYTFRVLADSDVEGVELEVSLSATVTDGAGNASEVSQAAASVSIDTQSPNVLSFGPSVTAANSSTGAIVYTVVFSERVNGFAEDSNITVENGSIVAGSWAQSSDGKSYTFSVLADSGLQGASLEVSINGVTISDFAGNEAVVSRSADPVLIDTQSPSVVSFGPSDGGFAAGGTLTLSSREIEYTIEFSEAVTGFANNANITVEHGQVVGVWESSEDSTIYRFTVQADIGVEGDLEVSLNDVTLTDSVGNSAVVSQAASSVSIDTQSPSVVSFGLIDPNVEVTAADREVEYRIEFSEAVSGLEASDIIVEHGTLVGDLTPSSDGLSYSFTVEADSDVEGVELEVSLSATVTDGAGNASDVSQAAVPVSIDTQSPSVLSFGPSVTAANSSTGAIVYTVEFSEAVTGFGADAITVSNDAPVEDFTSLDGGARYTFSVTAPDNVQSEQLVVSFDAATVTDAAGNASVVSQAAAAVSIDTQSPSVVSFGPSDGNFAAGGTLTLTDRTVEYTVEFSEAVLGFTADNISLTDGVVEEFTSLEGGTRYTFNVTAPGNAQADALEVSLSGTISDVPGNDLALSESDSSLSIDTLAPSLLGFTRNDEVADEVSYIITFTEGVSGFGASDISVGSGSLSEDLLSVSSDGATYSFTVADVDGVSPEVSINATVVSDAVGNVSPIPVTAAPAEVDETPPSVLNFLSDASSATLNNREITYTVEFSEAVTGFANNANITVLNGRIVGVWEELNDGSIYRFTVEADIGVEGDLEVSLNDVTIRDLAGNTALASISADPVSIDTLAPSVVNFGPSDANFAADGTLTLSSRDVEYTVTFSEAVTDFDAAAITVRRGHIVDNALTPSADEQSYTFIVRADSGVEGDLEVLLNDVTLTDSAGNSAVVSQVAASVSIDTQAPSVLVFGPSEADFAADGTLTLSDREVEYRVEFSEAVSGLSVADISVENGTLVGDLTPSVDGLSYTFTVQADTDVAGGQLSVSINDAVVSDFAGNAASITRAAVPISIDTQAPSVLSFGSIVTEVNSSTGAIEYTVEFSEAVTGFDAGAITVVNGIAENFASFDGGSRYTFSVTAPDNVQGQTLEVSLAATVTDAAGNASEVSQSAASVSIDTQSPSVVSFGPSDANFAAGGTLTLTDRTVEYTVEFSEAVLGFTADNISLTDGVVEEFTSLEGGTRYTFNVTAPGNAQADALEVSLSGTISDVPGNDLALSESDSSLSIDTLAPSLLGFTRNDEVADEVSYIITFTEGVSGFGASDISVGSGSLSEDLLSVSSDGATYSFTVADVAGVSPEVSINATDVSDVAGNVSTIPVTAAPALVDTIAPSVVSLLSDGSSATLNNREITYTVEFSEAVTGFANNANITIENGRIVGDWVVSEDDRIYRFTVEADSGVEGDLEVSLNGVTIRDLAGNTALASISADPVSIDTSRPTATMSSEISVVNIDTDGIVYTVEFSEAVSSFTSSDIEVTSADGTLTSTVSGSGSSYTVTVEVPVGTTGPISARVLSTVTDDAGNALGVAVEAADIVVDREAASITSFGPVVESAVATAADREVEYRVEFSESVSGLEASDIIVEHGTLVGDLTPSSDGLSYSFTVEADSDVEGVELEVSLSATVTDGAGNASEVSQAAVAVSIDTQAPSVVSLLSDASSATLDNSEITYTVEFSERVNDFANDSNITVENGSIVAGSWSQSSDGKSYTFRVSAGDGVEGQQLEVSLNDVTISDFLGNTALVSISADPVSIDTLAPRVLSFSPDKTSATQDNSEITYTVEFSEAVTGFDVAAITATHGVVENFTSLEGGTRYTFSVSALGNVEGEDLVVSLDTTVTDVSGNTFALSQSDSSVSIDTLAPRLLSFTRNDETSGEVSYSITFTEGVSGFDASDISVGSGVLAEGALNVSSDGLTYSFTVADVDGVSPAVSINATEVRDAVGNVSSIAPTPAPLVVDTTPPSVVSLLSDGSSATLDNSEITYTVEFSERVNGFADDSNITVENGSIVSGSWAQSSDGKSYTFSVLADSGLQGASLEVSINGVTISDFAGNEAVAARSADPVSIDTQAPSVFDFNGFNEDLGGRIAYTLTFSEKITDFDITKISVVNGELDLDSWEESPDGTTYKFSVQADSGSIDVSELVVAINDVTIIDSVGNESKVSKTASVLIDETPLSVLNFAPNIDSANSETGSITYTVEFSEAVSSFTAEDIEVTSGETTLTPNAPQLVEGTNTYIFTVDVPEDSTDSISASVLMSVTDLAGNALAAEVPANNVEVDTIAPDAPVITGISDDRGVANDDGLTSDNTLVFSGTGEAGATVTLLLDDIELNDSIVVGDDGIWSYDHSATELEDGDYTLAARQTDAVGNASVISTFNFKVETDAPTATITPPTLTGVVDAGELLEYQIEFSDPYEGFAADDVTILSDGVAQDNTNLNLVITPVTEGDFTRYTLAFNAPTASDVAVTPVTVSLDLSDYTGVEGNAFVNTAANSDVQVGIDGTELFADDEVSRDFTATFVDSRAPETWAGGTLVSELDLTQFDTSEFVSMEFLLADTPAFNQDVSGWDVSNVTNMLGVFYNVTAFDQDISGWDVSNATDISSMFEGASAFNQDISGWDVSNATDMQFMFHNAVAFNQDISGWEVSSVTTMEAMFGNADAFNQDISGWDVSNVENMSRMFSSAAAFNGDISGWEVSSVTTMEAMFGNADAFNQDISGWDVSNVENMSRMFSSAFAFNGDISGWDVSNVTDMTEMFNNAEAFNGDISNWDVSNVENMTWIFLSASAFNQDLGDWNISKVDNFFAAFVGASMSTINLDETLRGWARVDVGESLQRNVDFSRFVSTTNDALATDATALQFFADQYNRTINLDDTIATNVVRGANDAGDTLGDANATTSQIIHGLGGNDAIVGGTEDDEISGGTGDDILTGGDGADRIMFSFFDAGNDTITDFNTEQGDVIDLSYLLIGFDAGANIADYVTAADDNGNVVLTIDHDRGLTSNEEVVTITLEGLSMDGLNSPAYIQDLIDNGNLMLPVRRIEGDENDNTFDGTADDELIRGGDGNDTFNSATGRDDFRGGAGNDTMHVDVSFVANLAIETIYDRSANFDGGQGEDTLVLGDGAYDFSAAISGRLTSIEVLDLNQSATLTNVTLDEENILSMGSGLRIEGNADDFVTLLGFTPGDSVDGYTTYSSNGVDVLVSDAVTVNT